jgi:hypothetical protein
MHDDLIGVGPPQQGRACVALLAASFLPALLAQALGLSHKAIGGRRQVTGVTIFGQLLFQRLHPLLQLSDQGITLGQSLLQFFILLSQLKQFFFCRHAFTLHSVELFGKSLGHLSSYLAF